MKCYPCRSPQETQALAVRLSRKLRSGHLLLLKGDLGAGKTCFTQGIAAGLGIEGPVQSPTFILIAEYTEGKIPLRHVDLYRLEREEEVLALGMEERFEDGLWVVEWPERFDGWPTDHLEVLFRELPEYRELCLRATGPQHQELEDV